MFFNWFGFPHVLSQDFRLRAIWFPQQFCLFSNSGGIRSETGQSFTHKIVKAVRCDTPVRCCCYCRNQNQTLPFPVLPPLTLFWEPCFHQCSLSKNAPDRSRQTWLFAALVPLLQESVSRQGYICSSFSPLLPAAVAALEISPDSLALKHG